MGRREDVGLAPLGEQLAGERVELGDALDLVPEEIEADDELLLSGLQFERVA